MSLFEEMTRRYAANELPWNVELPPPEVIAEVAQMSPGRALDLGCGPGRASIYLAQHGWQCDGVDFIAAAVALASERAAAAGLAERARFHCASVTQLDFLEPPYDFALDVGCVHMLRDADLQHYATGLARLMRPGGRYLLFARLAASLEEPRGLPRPTVETLFAPVFTFERVVQGESNFSGTVAASAWFWLRRAV